MFRRTSTPTETSELEHRTEDHDQSLSEYDKSLDDHGLKTGYETELADLNTSQETSNTANILADISPENSSHEPKPFHKYPPAKYSYGSSLFGKNLRSTDKSPARESAKISDYKSSEKSAELVSLSGQDDRPESRHSSLSSYSLSQPVSI